MGSHRLSGFLGLSLALHAGILLFVVQRDSRPRVRKGEVLEMRLIEPPQADTSPRPNPSPSRRKEVITPPKLLAQPRPLPAAQPIEVTPPISPQELLTPVEPPLPAPAPTPLPAAPSNEEVRSGPSAQPQGAGRAGEPWNAPSSSRFAVATPPSAGGGLTFPTARGGDSSLTGVGSGNGAGGGESTGSGGRVSQPKGGYQVLPRYPESARRQGFEGITELKVQILSDGSVGQVIVARSAGHPELDDAAVQAVRRWRFEPARRGDVPVAVWAMIPIRFHLE